MTTTIDLVQATVPGSLSETWNRLDGVTVDGNTVTLDPERYFFRYGNPSWLVCDWDAVRSHLLDVTETPEMTLEQQVLDFVRQYGRTTTDPAEVLSVAWHVYAYLFRDDHLADPDLTDVNPLHLRILREVGTVMSLNRVELTGHISNVGPAWFFGDTARVVFDLTVEETMALDELYHGGFFNEARRVESIKAHAALGGRLVHGCQSAPNQSGGVVAPYGVDVTRFHADLATFKAEWRQRIIDQVTTR
jgi:hypothetical protein